MYNIKAAKDDNYVDCWTYRSKNEYNQTILLEIYQIDDNPNYMNVKFNVATKRKHGFREGEITGKDGIKSFVWAKYCIIHFLDNYSTISRLKDKVLVIYPANARLRKIYERSLIPLGFKINKSKYRELYMKLNTWQKC